MSNQVSVCQLSLVLSLFILSAVCAQDEKSPVPQPIVKKIGVSTFRVGEIEFDAKTKVISIPVVVNKREGGPIEYVLVRETGKTHESILTTKASPMDLQIVLKLLKYIPGEGDIFDRLLPAEDRKVKGAKSDQRGSSVSISVQWKDGDETKTVPVNQWVLDGNTIKKEGDPGESMPSEPWSYTGSAVSEGKFLAEMEGSFIAIYLDPASIFNTPVSGSETDDRWGANARLIPEIGVNATLLIQPATEKQ